MLGIDDPIIILGYLLAIGATLFCIVYGWLKRNEEEEEDG
jgi:hypothetical protein